jgi:molybdate transport system regulatory protein
MDQLTPRISLHIDSTGKLGSRQVALLEAIQSQGSIRGASRLIGLSYPGALLVIKGINKALGGPAVSTAKGGHKGGGAALTSAGIQVIQLYRAMEARVQTVAIPERRELLKLVRPKKGPYKKRGT